MQIKGVRERLFPWLKRRLHEGDCADWYGLNGLLKQWVESLMKPDLDDSNDLKLDPMYSRRS